MKSLIAVAILVLIRPAGAEEPASQFVSGPGAARAAPVPLSGLYEEDLLASSPIRVEQWQQMRAYIAALPQRDSGDPARNAQPEAETTEGLRRFFRGLLGYPPPEFLAAPSARMVKVGEDAAATYYRCYVKVAPEMETYGLYLVPKRAVRPAPLVIALHGGSGYPELATFHGGTNYHDMVRGAVAQGYVVFAPLTLMWPARDRDHGTPIPPDVRTTLMGVEAAKISRALDVLAQRPEVDPRRIAVIGLSYGGYYALYTAALDPRIRVVIASGCFSDRVRNDPFHPEKPRKPIDLSSVELVRLICPRPLQVQAGIRDPQHPVSEARRAAPLARALYPGPESARFDFEAFAGVHEFRGDIAWPFLRRFLDQ